MGVGRGYLVAVADVESFGELLASLPRSGPAEWRAAATRQLRGREPSSLDVDLGGGIAVPPYAPVDPSAEAPRLERERVYVLADLHAATRLAPADVLAELEGGAQGLWLPRGGLPAGGLPEVRFDFLVTALASAGGGAVPPALEVIPPGQRGDAQVWVASAPAEAAAVSRALRREFPKGAVVIADDLAGADPFARTLHRVRRLGEALAGAAAPAEARELCRGIVLAVTPPADYLEALVELRAVGLAFGRLCAGAGVADGGPPLRTWARIAPTGPEQTPEHYLVDATVRATAALTAGATAVSVAAHAGSDPARERRRARNVANVLQLETDLASAGDPLAGAAWVEGAAAEVLRRVWDGLERG